MYMNNDKSFFLKNLVLICGILASIISFFHYFFIQIGVFNISSYMQNAPLSIYKRLFHRYRVHVMRAAITLLLKTPLRGGTLRLVNFNIPFQTDSGYIIVTCHTQWEGLLVQSSLENNYGLIIGRRKWKKEKKQIQRKGKGYSNLRNIIRHLQQNGKIFIAADSFNKLNNCPVKFRGKYLNASKLPSRLASAASVPLIVALPILKNSNISFKIGPEFKVKDLKEDSKAITQQIISFIDYQLTDDYRVWSSLGR